MHVFTVMSHVLQGVGQHALDLILLLPPVQEGQGTSQQHPLTVHVTVVPNHDSEGIVVSCTAGPPYRRVAQVQQHLTTVPDTHPVLFVGGVDAARTCGEHAAVHKVSLNDELTP